MTELRRYESAAEFLNDTMPFLARDEALNSLMLFNALRLRERADSADASAYMAAVVGRRGAMLAAMKMPGYALGIYAPELSDAEPYQRLAGDLMRAGVRPDKVLALAETAERFAGIWTEETKQRSSVRMRMGCYRLDRVITPARAAGGRMRWADESEADKIAGWIVQMGKEIGEECTREQAENAAAYHIRERQIGVWEDSAAGIVSMACKTRPTMNGMADNRVYTPPEHRHRGYAASCVAAVSQSVLDAGFRFCTLFTDLANPASNGIYRKIGYEFIGEFAKIGFTDEKA